MYTYQMEVHSEEHFLFGKEIAEIYGLQTLKGQPNSRVVNLVLEEYRILNNIDPYPVLTYVTGWGPQRVWPHAIYDPAMRWFIQTFSRVTSYKFSNGAGNANFRIANP